MNIVVRRSGALGDVILTTPVIRRLRFEYPDDQIHILTAYPDVFRDNPYATSTSEYTGTPDLFVDLDLAYEKQPQRHIVHAYMDAVFGDVGPTINHSTELFLTGSPAMFSRDRSYVAVHAAVAGWANRTLPRETWLSVIKGIQAAGLWPILIGSPRDDVPGADVTRFSTTDIHAIAKLIRGCAAFVGSDSGLLHVAGTTRTPIVGVFTCASPATRLPWRDGMLGADCIAIVPHLACVGCLARRPAPVTTEYCERHDNACVNEALSERIVDAVVKAVRFKRK